METLTQMKCVACRKDEPTVTDAEIADFHPQVPDWEIVELDGIKRLRRIFSFDDFAQALVFTNRAGELAEEEGHHPALLTEWGKDDGHVVDAQDQGPASQRLRHGGEDRRALSAITDRVQEADAMRERVRTAPVARLATIDPDGRPHLVPIVFALDGQTLYSPVDAKPKRSRKLRRVANARERPDVTVLVDHYEDDWGRLWWVRLRGRARVLDAGTEAEQALRLLVDKYEQYRREQPGCPVLAVDVFEWRSWDAAAST
jgi:PPOX class probable F420-dependent enzyme